MRARAARSLVASSLAYTFAVSLASAVPAAAQSSKPILVTGTVRDAAGAPLALAEVRLHTPEGRYAGAIAMARVRDDGRFTIALPDTGAYFLVASAVDHDMRAVPIVLDRPQSVVLDVRLARLAYRDSLTDVRVIGDFDGFELDGGRPMQRQPDGTWRIELDSLPADTLAYQLVGLLPGVRSVNGTDAHHHIYDGGGDYRSVVAAEGRKATIVFDPARLVRSTAAGGVTFADPGSRAARVAAVLLAQDARSDALRAERRRAAAAHDSVRFDDGPWYRAALARFQAERDPSVRELLLLQLVELGGRSGLLDPALAARVVREVPATSPWWGFTGATQPYLYGLAVRVAHQQSLQAPMADTALVSAQAAYLRRMGAAHGSEPTRFTARGSLIFTLRDAGRLREANDEYLRLVNDFPGHPGLDFFKAQFASDRALKVGAPMPDYRFRGLTDSTIAITPAAMQGKVYLLAFWATWCAPCITELPNLHRAYEKYRGRGFDILSVSLDASPAEVARLRAGQWTMPWRHAFADGGMESPAMRALQIAFLPREVLVSADGVILAADDELRGDRLEQTLARVLPGPQP